MWPPLPTSQELQQAHQQTAFNVLAHFYKSDDYSDLTLQLGTRSWRVHKLVICSQSTFFKSVCKREWKEGQEGIVKLQDDAPAAVESMLEFLYTGAYPRQDLVRSGLVNHLHAWQAADKYDIPALVQIAADNFLSRIVTDWVALGSGDVIRDLYEECPDNALGRKLRDAVVRVCVLHEHELLHAPKYTEFRAVVQDVALFGIEFQKASFLVASKQHQENLDQKLGAHEASLKCLQKKQDAKLAKALASYRHNWNQVEEQHNRRLKEQQHAHDKAVAEAAEGGLDVGFDCKTRGCTNRFVVSFTGAAQKSRGWCPACKLPNTYNMY